MNRIRLNQTSDFKMHCVIFVNIKMEHLTKYIYTQASWFLTAKINAKMKSTEWEFSIQLELVNQITVTQWKTNHITKNS